MPTSPALSRAALLALALALGALTPACGDSDDGHGTAADTTHVHDADADASEGDTSSAMPDLSGGDAVAVAGKVTHTPLSGGATSTAVDASDAEAWVYLDLPSGDQVTPASPSTDTGWDLAIQRFRIAANGGISGAGDVAVAILDGVTFDAVTTAPADGWRVDAADGDDEDTEADLAFLVDGGWYTYDPAHHTLAPRADRVYVIRAHGGAGYFKVRVVDYYDAAGSGGLVTFHWAPVDPPASVTPADQFDVTAPTGQRVYVSLGDPPGVIAAPSEPSASTDWDLAIEGLGLATNSGTSGAALGGARAIDGAYDAAASADTVGFEVDASLPLPGPPGSGTYSGSPALADWYDYDAVTHTVSPKDQTYLVRTAHGRYVKLSIAATDGDLWSLRAAPLPRVPEVHRMTVTAPQAAAPVFVDLRGGAVVTPTAPSDDPSWDLAIQGVVLTTNGGTSGSGDGAAVALAVADLAAATEAPAEGWTADAMQPLPGPPGSGEISANPVLGGWYDYDPVGHTVSAKSGAVYAVRTADGGVAALQIEASDGETYTFAWIYAGPGATRFDAEPAR